MPDTKTYLDRIHHLSGGEDFVAVQASTAQQIAQLIDGVPDAELHRSPKPGKWSVIEIIAHLAEDELVTSWRYRQMLETPGCVLPGFDQDRWAGWGRYQEWTADEALAMFRLLRNANLRLLRGLTPDEWARWGTHAERGRITIADLARHMAGHDRNHLQQIRDRLASQR